jgi:hypothetical protein
VVPQVTKEVQEEIMVEVVRHTVLVVEVLLMVATLLEETLL